MASQTVLTLAVSLGVLYALTRLTGQPVTVAMLGVMVSMMSSMAVQDPDRRQQLLTIALLPLPAAAAVALGAVLATHRVAGDVAFVAIVAGAVYVRRFGGRGMALGMVAFMTYFFALFLGATLAQLPWLIAAVIVATGVSLLLRAAVFRPNPRRELQRSVRSLRARGARLVDTTATAVRVGGMDQRAHRRLQSRTAQFNDSVLAADALITPEALSSAADLASADADEARLALFDLELAGERLVGAGFRLAREPSSTDRAPAARQLQAVAAMLRHRGPRRDSHCADDGSGGHPADRELVGGPLGRAVSGVLDADARLCAAIAAFRTVTTAAAQRTTAEGSAGLQDTSHGDDRQSELMEAQEDRSAGSAGQALAGLRPTTRQAIQVSIAAALAIIAGELLSPARWYWAAITAFVIFSNTTSRGQILNRGWQRVAGTALGVPVGVLIATAVGGRTVVSLLLIFVCLFSGFYLIKVGYGWMVFFITTMLALLYGLLGQFSVATLVLRIEETAVGAAIGAVVAVLVLPSSTRTDIRAAAADFLDQLADLICDVTAPATPGSATPATTTGRDLDQQLRQLNTAAQPAAALIPGLRAARPTRRALRIFTACDRYARHLARAGTALASATASCTDATHAGGPDSAPDDVAAAQHALTRTGAAVADTVRGAATAARDARPGNAPGRSPASAEGGMADVVDSVEVPDVRVLLERQGGSVLAGELRTALTSLMGIDRAVRSLTDIDLPRAAAQQRR